MITCNIKYIKSLSKYFWSSANDKWILWKNVTYWNDYYLVWLKSFLRELTWKFRYFYMDLLLQNSILWGSWCWWAYFIILLGGQLSRIKLTATCLCLQVGTHWLCFNMEMGKLHQIHLSKIYYAWLNTKIFEGNLGFQLHSDPMTTPLHEKEDKLLLLVSNPRKSI